MVPDWKHPAPSGGILEPIWVVVLPELFSSAVNTAMKAMSETTAVRSTRIWE